MKRALKILLPILILGGAVGVFAALKATKPHQPKAKAQERVWRVEVETVSTASLSPTLVLYGQVESPELFRAAAPSPAQVAEVAVREGDRVKAGQLLVALDPRDFDPRLQQARAEVTELEARIRSEELRHESDKASLIQERKLLKLAEQNVQRQRRLMKQQLGSESALDDAEQTVARQQLTLASRRLAIADHPARLGALEARLQRAQAGLAQIELDAERSRVQAPFDGIVARVPVAVGDQVKDNEELAAMYDPEALEVRARVPAPYQAELQQALADGESLSAATADGDGVALHLVRLAGEADTNGVDALFRIDSGRQWLRMGQVLNFRLQRPAREGALAVPYPAVYGNNRIYTLEDGRMRTVSVRILGNTLNEQGQERALVQAEGLKSGAQLVVTHLPNAIDGLRAEAVGRE